MLWPGFRFAMERKQITKITTHADIKSDTRAALKGRMQTSMPIETKSTYKSYRSGGKTLLQAAFGLLPGVQMLFVRPDKALNPKQQQRQQSFRAQTSGRLADTRPWCTPQTQQWVGLNCTLTLSCGNCWSGGIPKDWSQKMVIIRLQLHSYSWSLVGSLFKYCWLSYSGRWGGGDPLGGSP